MTHQRTAAFLETIGVGIGADSMVVHLLDGYGQTPDTTFYFSINDCGKAHTPVHLSRRAGFSFAHAGGVDSMSVVLAIDKQPSEYTPDTRRALPTETGPSSLMPRRRFSSETHADDTGSRGLMVTVETERSVSIRCIRQSGGAPQPVPMQSFVDEFRFTYGRRRARFDQCDKGGYAEFHHPRPGRPLTEKYTL